MVGRVCGLLILILLFVTMLFSCEIIVEMLTDHLLWKKISYYNDYLIFHSKISFFLGQDKNILDREYLII